MNINLIVNLLLLLSLLLPLPVSSDSTATYTMAFPRSKNDFSRQLIEPVFVEAFKRAGAELNIISCPPLTCSIYVKQGKVDGELLRAMFYKHKLPGLVAVDASIYSITFSAYSLKPLIMTRTEDLAMPELRIGYMRGLFWLDNELRRIGKHNHVTRFDHWNTGINMLINDKLDVLLGIQHTIEHRLRENNHNSVHRLMNLKTIPLYTFFNQEHKDFAKKMESVYREMKSEGIEAEIQNKIRNAN